LLGIVFCIIALSQISSQSEPQEGRMLAILGLVLSVASLLFYMALGLLQAVFGSNTINWQTGQL
jgi:threonine/homoserine/homoserine lactone efflux protein